MTPQETVKKTGLKKPKVSEYSIRELNNTIAVMQQQIEYMHYSIDTLNQTVAQIQNELNELSKTRW